MRTQTLAALALAGLMAGCSQPKDRNAQEDSGGPLRTSGATATSGPSSTAPAGPVAPAISASLKPRPEFPAFYLDRINQIHDPLKTPGTVDGNAPIEMSGFGYDVVAKAPAKGIDLDIDGQLFGTTYGSPRPDVASAAKVPALTATGYQVTLPPGALKAGPHQVVVRVVAADGQSYYQSPVIHFTVR